MKIIYHDSSFLTLFITILITLSLTENYRILITDAFTISYATSISNQRHGTYCDRRSHTTSIYLKTQSDSQIYVSNNLISDHGMQMNESINTNVHVMDRVTIGSRFIMRTMALTMAAVIITALSYTSEAYAVDSIGPDISKQNLSNGSYENRDFSGITAIGTDFQKSNLQGCNFNKANLMNANLSGADISGATFQGTILDGAILKDVNAIKTIFSESILDVGTFENADLTDSLWPSKLQIMICDMSELKGTSSNGINTRDSILCPL